MTGIEARTVHSDYVNKAAYIQLNDLTPSRHHVAISTSICPKVRVGTTSICSAQRGVGPGFCHWLSKASIRINIAQHEHWKDSLLQ